MNSPTSLRSPAHSGAVSRRILLMAAALLVPGLARAEDPPKPRVLFDGKTLDGWKSAGYGGSGELVVEEGAIVLKAGMPMTGVTTAQTDLPTADYELVYEARRVDGRDFFAAATFPVGKAFVTWVNGGWGGTVTGLSSLDGADASENETNRFFKYENGTWYRFRLRVTAAKIRGWIDDKAMIDLEHDGRLLTTRLETRSNQPLGFAAWKGTAQIRKVEIRPLTAEEVRETNKTEP